MSRSVNTGHQGSKRLIRPCPVGEVAPRAEEVLIDMQPAHQTPVNVLVHPRGTRQDAHHRGPENFLGHAHTDQRPQALRTRLR